MWLKTLPHQEPPRRRAFIEPNVSLSQEFAKRVGAATDGKLRETEGPEASNAPARFPISPVTAGIKVDTFPKSRCLSSVPQDPATTPSLPDPAR
jgi:hypothetical protein